MRKLLLKMHVSLDGYVAGPDGEVDWISPTLDEGATSWLMDTLWQSSVHVMGARTYRDMAAHWPGSREIFAAPMNDIPKFVFSRTMAQADWADTHIVRGEMMAEIQRLKRLPGRDMLAHGGARFARSLVRLGLVDEYRLLVHPVVLGRGMPLFSDLDERLDMALMSTRQFGSGAMAMVYRPADEQSARAALTYRRA